MEGAKMDRNPDEGRRVSARGITLIELLAAIAIVGILAALAWPAFSDQLRKGRRVDAVTALYKVQLDQERYRAGYRRYAAQLSELGWDGDEADSPGGHYRISLEVVDDPRLAFRARAVPRPGSDQTRDRCVLFVLDQSGPDLNASSAPACWSR
jgi:type IV pilus assembly protein PilE